ncbi:DUF5597 domain-containing protein [Paenarthrobacter sp. AR 02]|uniref:DUF5597 domain-containing protein n=1 Tax=Paenarthrobacter sp. AR 02 TaxID=2899821 RepID=UPI001F2669BE|nr:DUF5597 domain-containing protein [Paenarthrobacter sp. AR 02]MCF3140727.1 DUF5597 domain-containing protein [Paenarthrobacter sp. AR 02]
MPTIPTLERQSGHARLVVDGKPFLCIGGELHNSSSSDRGYMAQYWGKLAASKVNTVIATVSWEQVEPTEGNFDFSIVDGLIEDAKAAGLRLVLIWFGAFKNASSTYAPSWVRGDPSRFPRADRGLEPMQTPFSYKGSMPRPTLSVFSVDLFEADKAAYCRFMAHLAETDEDHTVIMVQVENEVGLLGAARDLSAAALAAWQQPVPEALRKALVSRESSFDPGLAQTLRPIADSDGSWADHFGDGNPVADETFMAWAFAEYVGGLAAAGKEFLNLPAYANAWIGPQPGQDLPGNYPSGGPTAKMLPVWKAAAPALDFLAPDIYVPYSAEVMAQYASPENPLFIPEARFRAGDVFLSVGRFGGFGYHVFGLEDGREGNQFSSAAQAIISLTQEIVDAQREGRIFGFALEENEDDVVTEFGSVTVSIRNAAKLYTAMLLDAGVVLPPPPELPGETEGAAHGHTPGDNRPFGLVIETGPLEYLVVGQGALFDFHSKDSVLEVDSVRELRLTPDGWQEGRLLNGDERLQVLQSDRISASFIRLLDVGRD